MKIFKLFLSVGIFFFFKLAHNGLQPYAVGDLEYEIINLLKKLNMKDKTSTLQKTANSIKGAVIGRFICAFKGHFPEKYLNETEGWICTTRCKRCHRTLMGGMTWKIKHIPPPNSNEQQIKEWEKYCEDKWQTLRETCL